MFAQLAGATIGSDNRPLIGWSSAAARAGAVALSGTSVANGGFADGPLSPTTFDFWESGNANRAEWEVPVNGAVNYMAFAGHNFEGRNLIIKVDGNVVGQVAIPPSRPFFPIIVALPLFEQPETVGFELLSEAGFQRPRLTVFYAGLLLQTPPQRRIYSGHEPIAMARDYALVPNISESGNLLGNSVLRRGFQNSVSLTNLPPSWVRNNYDPFHLAAEQGRPYFWVWRPKEYPGETAYAWRTGGGIPQNSGVGRGFMDVRWNQRALGVVEPERTPPSSVTIANLTTVK